jgi:hypothetical protein
MAFYDPVMVNAVNNAASMRDILCKRNLQFTTREEQLSTSSWDKNDHEDIDQGNGKYTEWEP